ncbi:unnamed protein product (macronuclear) [Paramecium tetraurelia]|uniref:Uncharacterized protein n=1 Tax=Paramecium tetraurelia TaxID=5888 RepID=A0BY69_PARTE|nr:uncharacterized protein GSPATT00033339001 [Paramecium tetraurelia]CAK63486.1 unnamed protein product [Paramecium tetraurelia]|eukprot:XP_001430884.1 hypothetical protein (macronuclear) [Paramecium tetraurelia strain d4-2]
MNQTNYLKAIQITEEIESNQTQAIQHYEQGMIQLMYRKFDSSQDITNPSAFQIQKAQFGVQQNQDGQFSVVRFPSDSSFLIDNLDDEDDVEDEQEQQRNSEYIYTPKEFEPDQEFMNCLKRFLQVGTILNKIKK